MFFTGLDYLKAAGVKIIPKDYKEDSTFVGFKDLSLGTLKKLFDSGEINPEDRQNESPTNAEFFKFMKKHPRFTAHGYICLSPRPDARIGIEGLDYKGRVTISLIIEFSRLSARADDLIIERNNLYSWYD